MFDSFTGSQGIFSVFNGRRQFVGELETRPTKGETIIIDDTRYYVSHIDDIHKMIHVSYLGKANALP